MKTTTLFRTSSRSYSNLIPVAIGLVYLWFGALKFFPGISPAEDLAVETIHALTFHLFSDRMALVLLATWEVTVGIFLIVHLFRKITLYVALLHMVLTFTPFILLPDLVFTAPPFGLTLVGQYIVKNLIILGILIVLIRQLKDR